MITTLLRDLSNSELYQAAPNTSQALDSVKVLMFLDDVEERSFPFWTSRIINAKSLIDDDEGGDEQEVSTQALIIQVYE